MTVQQKGRAKQVYYHDKGDGTSAGELQTPPTRPEAKSHKQSTQSVCAEDLIGINGILEDSAVSAVVHWHAMVLGSQRT